MKPIPDSHALTSVPGARPPRDAHRARPRRRRLGGPVKPWFHLATLTALTALAALAPAKSRANERHFTYTYETATLPPGTVELEPWTTVKFGRDHYYARFDQRLELEAGLAENLQTALYLNARTQAQEVPALGGGAGRVLQRSSSLRGVSWETKWKLADPVADPLGVALYFEVGLQPHEVGFEGKVLLDKRVGGLLLAFNGVAELELEREGGKTERKLALEASLAAGWSVSRRVVVGLEVFVPTVLEDGDELQSSALYAGPSVSYAGDAFWAALTVMPQFARLGGDGTGRLDLVSNERLQARLLLGFGR